jgi:hypothetical protein
MKRPLNLWACNLPQERHHSVESVPKKEIPVEKQYPSLCPGGGPFRSARVFGMQRMQQTDPAGATAGILAHAMSPELEFRLRPVSIDGRPCSHMLCVCGWQFLDEVIT